MACMRPYFLLLGYLSIFALSFFMSLLIWNIQSDAAKRSLHVLTDYCHQYKPLILALVEPKVLGPQAESISLGLDFNEWVQVEAIGLSGGIWVFWQP